MQHLKYKNFIAEVHYIAQTKCFYGEVINCKDLIVFQAEDQKDLEETFKVAVQQYQQYQELLGSELKSEELITG